MAKNPAAHRYMRKERTKRPYVHSKSPNKHEKKKPYARQGR